jgi:hypothetical protein
MISELAGYRQTRGTRAIIRSLPKTRRDAGVAELEFGCV